MTVESLKNAERGDCVFLTWDAIKTLGDEWLKGSEIAGVRDNGLLIYLSLSAHGEQRATPSPPLMGHASPSALTSEPPASSHIV